jgi:hypothetical protein
MCASPILKGSRPVPGFHNKTTVKACLIGMTVIYQRITAETTRIPLRLIFALENNDKFEHIFQAEAIDSGGMKLDIAGLQAIGIESLKGCQINQAQVTTRPDAQAQWEQVNLELHNWVMLTIEGKHQRQSRTTNTAFIDGSGLPIWHASYCYLGTEPCSVDLPL